MKESTLNTVDEDEDDDGIDDNDQEQLDYEEINRKVDNFQDRLEHIKSSLVNVTKEIRILKEELNESESEYDMKKRLYDSAAAGLEAELSRREAEFERLIDERDDLIGEHFLMQTRLTAIRIEQSELLGVDKSVIQQLKAEIDSERNIQEHLRQQETEWKEKEQYYKKQMEMWRDIRAIFEVKQRLLAQKFDEEKNQQQSNKNTMTKDYLVLE
ncbi:intraflagellar transport 81-like protein [Euroglyphus maynei]|uniref:Intraflagellar transport 81-like protein n=1 Tax=Euroglyphus maynei TaxID=6958 RepID=A0A1Y3B855_EURMA|nr:intraflagellar transport 81-like protein [Euroglyphus maynei]